MMPHAARHAISVGVNRKRVCRPRRTMHDRFVVTATTSTAFPMFPMMLCFSEDQ